MNKKIITIAVAFLIPVLFIEIYWYNKYDGNVITCFQGETNYKYSDVDFLVRNGDEIFIDTVLDVVPLKIDMGFSNSSFGFGQYSVQSNKLNISEKKRMFFFPVTWLVVNIYDDRLELQSHYIPPFLQ